jgi:DNA primase
MELPYFGADGKHYRTKLFPWSGEPRSRWLGPSKPQIPYGLWRFPTEGDFCVLVEGESDLIALALAYPKLPVLGIPGVDSWQKAWWSYVADYRRIYLSPDGDGPGDGRCLPGKKPPKRGASLREKVLADIPEARTLLLPDGADTRDVLQELGKPAFKVLVEVADRSWEQKQAWAAMDAAVWRRRREVEIPWERRSS